MLALQLLPVVLSLLVLGAHFLRAGHVVLVLAVLSVLALLFVRRRWAARVVQVTLGFGTLVWVRTLFVLASLRMQTGEPVRRMVLILGSVAAVSLLSAWLMQAGRLRCIYRLDPDDTQPAGNSPSRLVYELVSPSAAPLPADEPLAETSRKADLEQVSIEDLRCRLRGLYSSSEDYLRLATKGANMNDQYYARYNETKNEILKIEQLIRRKEAAKAGEVVHVNRERFLEILESRSAHPAGAFEAQFRQPPAGPPQQRYCPRCRRSIVAPLASATSAYARYWRGVCPECTTALQ